MTGARCSPLRRPLLSCYTVNKPSPIKFVIMDYSKVVESYNQQIKALGDRYTFSNDMCEFMRTKLQCVSGSSTRTFFDVASSFCKFYQDSLETTKQINLITQERDFILDMMKRNKDASN